VGKYIDDIKGGMSHTRKDFERRGEFCINIFDEYEEEFYVKIFLTFIKDIDKETCLLLSSQSVQGSWRTQEGRRKFQEEVDGPAMCCQYFKLLLNMGARSCNKGPIGLCEILLYPVYTIGFKATYESTTMKQPGLP
jgi:hypothetical protein